MKLSLPYRVITITCLILISIFPLATGATSSSELPIIPTGQATTSQASSSAAIIKSKLLDRTWGRLINLTANITARQEKMLARLEQISVRLETRISLSAATSSDVKTARQELTKARTALNDSRTTLKSISITISTTTNTVADIEDAWSNARALYLESNTDLQTAKQALIRSLTALDSTTSSSTTPPKSPRS